MNNENTSDKKQTQALNKADVSGSLDLDFEFEQCERFSVGHKNSGKVVLTESGKKGIIYNKECSFNGKLKVHCVDGNKLLCDPQKLKLIGFID